MISSGRHTASASQTSHATTCTTAASGASTQLMSVCATASTAPNPSSAPALQRSSTAAVRVSSMGAVIQSMRRR